MTGVFYHSVIQGLGFFICFKIQILHVQNNKTRLFYVLYSNKTWVFDQSERVQGPIYLLIVFLEEATFLSWMILLITPSIGQGKSQISVINRVIVLAGVLGSWPPTPTQFSVFFDLCQLWPGQENVRLSVRMSLGPGLKPNILPKPFHSVLHVATLLYCFGLEQLSGFQQ